MNKRKLIGRFIIFGSLAVLLVPAIWERYQSKLVKSSLIVPEPERPYRNVERDFSELKAPDADAFFEEFYSVGDEKTVESDRPSMDEIATETPRAWVLKVREYQDASQAAQFEQQLRDLDYPSYVTPNSNMPGPYIVLVGPYLDFSRAQSYLEALSRDFDVTPTILKFKP